MLVSLADSVAFSTSVSTLSASSNQSVSAESGSPEMLQAVSLLATESISWADLTGSEFANRINSEIQTAQISLSEAVSIHAMFSQELASHGVVSGTTSYVLDEGGVIEINPVWQTRDLSPSADSEFESAESASLRNSVLARSAVFGEASASDWSASVGIERDWESALSDSAASQENAGAVDVAMQFDEGGVIELGTTNSFGPHSHEPQQGNASIAAADVSHESPVKAEGIHIDSEIGLHQAFELAESAANDNGESPVVEQQDKTGGVGDELPQVTSSNVHAATPADSNEGGAGESHVHAASVSWFIGLAALSMWAEQAFRGKRKAVRNNDDTSQHRRWTRLSALAQRVWRALSSSRV